MIIKFDNYIKLITEQVLEITSFSKIGDKEIIISENDIKELLSFVGGGVDWIDYQPKSNSVKVWFNEESIGGISLDDWYKAKKLLISLKGKNGFNDFIINSSYNNIELIFDFQEYPIGY